MARSPRAKSFKRVYWDPCSWIALIWDEKISRPDGTIENRGALCRAIVDDALKGAVEIFDVCLSTLVEVNKLPPLGLSLRRINSRTFLRMITSSL